MTSCQNVRECSEDNKDILIDRNYPIDSMLLDGFDPFFNEDCAMEISEMVKKEIITFLQEEQNKMYIQGYHIWFAITFRGTGEIVDFRLKTVIINKNKEKTLKKNIMKKKIVFKCNAINDLNAVEKKRLISWVIPIQIEN